MEFNELVKERRSCRSYKESEVKKEDIEEIIKCTLMAPSWKNSETGRYYVALSQETIKEVYECFYKGISFYAESLSEIRGKLNSLSEYVPKIEDKNPGLTKDLNNILKWGI